MPVPDGPSINEIESHLDKLFDKHAVDFETLPEMEPEFLGECMNPACFYMRHDVTCFILWA